MSDLGLRNLDLSDELKLIDEEGYIEAKVSITLFKTLIPDFENKTHTERVEFLTRNEEYLSLGYRVPTQGQNSMYMLKIVDFLPESVGDTIIFPKEGTAIGGFDFDIDKLYVVRYNYDRKGYKIKYDATKSIEENSEEALGNRLLDIYFGVLKNENHVVRRTTPLGYTADIMKKLASDMKSWKGVKEDVTEALTMVSPMYQLDVKERYKFGKEGLGPYALANVHHILGQSVDLGMMQYIGIGLKTQDGYTDLAKILGEDGIDITEWFSGLIDAHVDIAADPYIYYLNVNEYTRDLVTLLIRAGVGGTKTFKFVAQPVLEDIAKLRANMRNRLGVRSKNPSKLIRERYTNEMLKGTPKEFVVKKFSPEMLQEILSEGKLENNITVGSKNKTREYYNDQLLILDAFEYLDTYAKYLTEAILASRVDTKKFGSSYTEVLSYKNRTLKSYNDMYNGVGVRNFDKLMENTYLKALTENSVETIQQVMSNIVIEGTPAFTVFVDTILKVTGNLYTLDERMLPTLVDDIYSLVYGSFFKQSGVTLDHAKSLLYGDNSIPKTIHDIKAGSKFAHLKDNALIRAMDPVYNENEPDFISFSKPDNKWYRDDLARAWKDIFAGEQTDRDLAIKLFQYSFITSGFKGTINSFHDLVPSEIVKYTGLDKYIKDVLRTSMSNPELFNTVFDKLFTNNWNNDRMVPRFKEMPTSAVSITAGGEIVALSYDFTELKRGLNVEGQVVYAPYIKMGKKSPILYKYVGYLKDSNAPVYVPTAKKGYRKTGFVVNEASYEGSMFAENNSPVPESALQYTSAEGFVRLLSVSQKATQTFPGFIPVTNFKMQNLTESQEMSTEDEVNQRIKDCK
jgi:hypothetical protein